MENKFKFKNNEVEIEFSGERDFVENQVFEWKEYIQGNQSYNKVKEYVIKKDVPEEIKVIKKITLDEFFALKSPKNYQDKVITTIYYLNGYKFLLIKSVVNKNKLEATFE